MAPADEVITSWAGGERAEAVVQHMRSAGGSGWCDLLLGAGSRPASLPVPRVLSVPRCGKEREEILLRSVTRGYAKPSPSLASPWARAA